MKIASVPVVLRTSILVLGMACILAPAAIAASDANPPSKLPNLKSLSSPTKQSLHKARDELLSFLYDQLQRADSEQAAERVVSAIEKLWSRTGSDTANILMERAGLAMNARNYNLATQLLTALTDIDPNYAAAWSQLATVHFLQDDYVQAMHQLEHVLAIDPRHFKAIEGLGIILRETGNKKAALKVLRKALKINPYLKSAKQAEEELAREIEGQGA